MSARERLIGYALAATPNEVTFAKCEELADALAAEAVAAAAPDPLTPKRLAEIRGLMSPSLEVQTDPEAWALWQAARDLLADNDRLRENYATLAARPSRAEVLTEAADRLERIGWPTAAWILRDNAEQADAAEAGEPAAPPAAVEYATRRPGGTVLDDAPTTDREQAEDRLTRSRAMYPTARLVQRTVRYGPWTDAAEAGEGS